MAQAALDPVTGTRPRAAAAMPARRQAGLAALAFLVLFGAGSALWGLDMPARGTSGDELVAFFRDTSGRIAVGASLSLLGIAAAVWWAAALRGVIVEAGGDAALAATAYGGLLLSMAAGLGAETINMGAALRAADGQLDPALARSMFEVSQMLGSAAGGVGAGVFALATGVAALRARAVLPRPTAVVVTVSGIALLTPLSQVAALPAAVLLGLAALLAATLLRPDDPTSVALSR